MSEKSTAYKPLAVLFAIIAVVAAITVVSKTSHGDEKIPWRTDADAARDEAKRDGKPVLLYFTASWCGPCQMMKSETFSNADVEAKLRGFVPVKIDVDANTTLAQQYRINGIPTLVLLDTDGNIARQASGFMPAQQFLTWIDG